MRNDLSSGFICTIGVLCFLANFKEKIAALTLMRVRLWLDKWFQI